MNPSSSTDYADLYNAAKKGNFEMFKNYAEPLDHLLGQNKNTILHVYLNSPFKRSKEFVEQVLTQCPQLLWQTNDDGATPLHIAAKYRHVDIAKLFIEEAKKPIHRDLETGEEEEEDSIIRRMLRLTNKQKDTALHLAVRAHCQLVVREILKHEYRNFTYTTNESGETPLYLAAEKGAPHIANQILNKFESPDCGGPNGTTAFHAAAGNNIYGGKVVDLLLTKLGSFVNQADESGWTPLHYAAYFNNWDVARGILGKDRGSAYATEKDKCRTALHIAYCRGSVQTMREIINKCPDCCEIRDVRGWNILHYAVIDKSAKSVKAILNDPSLIHLLDEPDVKGYTPFQLLEASDQRRSILEWIDKSDVPYQLRRTRIDRTLISDFVDRDREKEEILEWMKDLGTDPLGKTFQLQKVRKDRTELQIERQEKIIPKLAEAKESHLVAAALVATVTFAAAFTLPGGYISDENNSKLQGTPILSRNAAFRAFVVTDAIAMVLSTSSVFIHFLMVMLGYKLKYYWLMRLAFWFILIAMGAMVVAFVTGTYAVLATPSKGLAIATCLIGLTFFLLVAYTSVRLIFDFVKLDKIENPYSSTSQSLVSLLESAPYLICGMWQRLVNDLDEDSETLKRIRST